MSHTMNPIYDIHMPILTKKAFPPHTHPAPYAPIVHPFVPPFVPRSLTTASATVSRGRLASSSRIASSSSTAPTWWW